MAFCCVSIMDPFIVLVVVSIFLGNCNAERNIAQGKSATQSSTLESGDLAIDGNYGTASRTQEGTRSWWMLDLQVQEHLSDIFLHFDNNDFWDIEVRLSLSGKTWTLIRPVSMGNYSISYKGPEKEAYRYIKVSHAGGNNSLSLAEVEIFRKPLTKEEKSRLPFKPRYTSAWFPMASQTSDSSEMIVNHGLDEVPVKVIADVKVKAENGYYIYQGLGGAQSDTEQNNKYGGLVVLYDKNQVWLFAPNDTKKTRKKKGKIIYTGSRDAWKGPDVQREFQDAYVRVRIWLKSDFPTHSFILDWTYVSTAKDVKSTLFKETKHFMNGYPDLVVVQVKIKHKEKTYFFEGQGSTSVLDVRNKNGITSGAVFGYSNESIRVWFPAGRTAQDQGFIFYADNGWGTADFRISKGHYRVFAWKFEPAPLYEIELPNSYDFKVPVSIPFLLSERMLISVQFEVQGGDQSGFRFSGVGSTMQDGSIYGQYGGLMYCLTNSSVLLWVPKTNYRNNGYIFNIGDMWGNNEHHQRTNDAIVRITIFGAFEREDIVCTATKNEFPYYSMDKTEFFYKEKLNADCQFGMMYVAGDETRTCQRNGLWNGSALDCRVIQCPANFTNSSHTYLNATGNRYMDILSYQCSATSRPRGGDQYRVCRNDSTWSGTPLKCKQCRCPCRNFSAITEITMDTLKAELIVNKEQLSSTVRKKTCAEDNRPAAQAFGYTAALFLTACFLLVVVPDIPQLYRHCSVGKKNMSRYFRKRKSKNKYTAVPLNEIEVQPPFAYNHTSCSEYG